MTIKKTRRYQIAATIIALLILVVFIFMAVGLSKAIYSPGKGLGSSDAAGWVQAIGAFVSIGAAVLVFHLQNDAMQRHAEQRDAAEVDGILACLLSEIDTQSRNAAIRVGGLIEATDPDTGVFIHYPVPEEPFKIYYALIPKLGAITDPALRVQIVETYSMAASFVATIRYNNKAVEYWKQAAARYRRTQLEADQAEMSDAYQAVVQYGNGVRSSWGLTYSMARDLVDALRNR